MKTLLIETADIPVLPCSNKVGTQRKFTVHYLTPTSRNLESAEVMATSGAAAEDSLKRENPSYIIMSLDRR